MRVLTESYRSTIFELMAALFVYLIQGHCADHFEIRCELGLFQLYTSESNWHAGKRCYRSRSKPECQEI